ncbi:ATP-binding protein [Streptomyces spirodelae]|uniref:ATP-binding protein n=1 Tax=Streptomyces spirodelae TaxID=2812904 RepID=A0ABS3WV93_9ACTN|nr:ATP-binding protein [Streptomyces spirodelae]MBO8187016.1 ATP-binding protein [Streptomyces spirodelae]
MSNPLTRRIARTALLTAAGAATVVGAAGAASAVELPASPVGGVSNLDGEGVGNTLDKTARDTTSLAGHTGGNAVKKTVPAAGRTVGKAGKTAAPAAQHLTGSAVGEAGDMLGQVAAAAADTHLPRTANLGGLPLG